MKSKVQKSHQKAKKPQSCPQFRLSGEFFDKIWLATSEVQGKGIKNIKSKMKKYMHKGQNLNRVHDFA